MEITAHLKDKNSPTIFEIHSKILDAKITLYIYSSKIDLLNLNLIS
jgi:hypothetical protein